MPSSEHWSYKSQNYPAFRDRSFILEENDDGFIIYMNVMSQDFFLIKKSILCFVKVHVYTGIHIHTLFSQ